VVIVENFETQNSNIVEKKTKGISNLSSLSPKVLAILLIVNLVIGIFNLAGIGYLSFKDNNRSQMIRNFDNGGGFNQPNGDMFNQQQQPSGSSN
jgi:hypothetical protein